MNQSIGNRLEKLERETQVKPSGFLVVWEKDGQWVDREGRTFSQTEMDNTETVFKVVRLGIRLEAL